MCAAYGQFGHPIQERHIAVGYICPDQKAPYFSTDTSLDYQGLGGPSDENYRSSDMETASATVNWDWSETGNSNTLTLHILLNHTTR